MKAYTAIQTCADAQLWLDCPGFCTVNLRGWREWILEIARDAEGMHLGTCGSVSAVTHFLPRKQSSL